MSKPKKQLSKHARTRQKHRPQTAQQTIPYVQMYKDGVCKVCEGYFTKTVRYEDINYSVASRDDQNAILDGYGSFLNYFDSNLPCQFVFPNRKVRERGYSVNIPDADDDFNNIRNEFKKMLKRQVARSNNGILRSRYTTFGVYVDDISVARQRLDRVESDIIGNYKKLGSTAYALNGHERLELLHSQLHLGGYDKFSFEWAQIPQTGMTTKDFIAPTSFEFKPRIFRTGKTWGATSYLQIMASEMSDKLLRDFLEMDAEMTVAMHVQAVDQTTAIKKIKSKVSDISKMKIDAQKQAVRAGYDMDILPPDLVTYSKDAENLLGDLQSRNERLFLLTFLVTNYAPTLGQLENDIFTASGIAQTYNCALKRLDFQQEQGFMSCLALGYNGIEIQRGLTTSSTAIFVPFMTQELNMGGQSLYYGQNALSHNVIMADRKRLKNPNGLILGTPGAGKSFAGKREIVNVFLTSSDDIIVIDPEAEYGALGKRLGGQVIKLSPSSKHFVNPMDISLDCGDDDPLALKSDFILSFCELILGGRTGISPTEKAVIDRCVRLVYRPFLENPTPENIPLLEDLYLFLLDQDEPEAKHLAVALEIYVSGSLNVFNHRTNVDLTNRCVVFDIKELGNQLKKLGMLILQDAVWNRVSQNRDMGKKTWLYLDEFHLLLKEKQTAAYSIEFWKRFRKWGGVPTGLTQNVKDLLSSAEIENILDNSDFILMLNQAGGDREILARHLGISEHQLSYVTQSPAGSGLLFYGDTIIPFADRFPKDTEIYRLLNTRPVGLDTEVGNVQK